MKIWEIMTMNGNFKMTAMKRNIIYVCFISAVLLIGGCTNKEDITPLGDKVKMTFSAAIEGFPETKTILDGGTDDAIRPIFWLNNDSIIVTNGSTYGKFINIVKENTASAFFEGEISVAESYSALYPFSENIIFIENSFHFILNSTQKYSAGTFASDYFPMVAHSSKSSFSFKNICGILVLKLKGEGSVKSITFTGFDSNNNNIKVSGSAKINMSYQEVPALIFTEEALDFVTLDCGEGVALSTEQDTPFYIVLPPNTYNTFKLSIVLTDGKVMNKVATKSLTIKRSERTTTSSLDFTEDPATDLSAKGTSNCYIVSSGGNYSFNAKIIGNGAEGLLPDIAQSDKKFHTENINISPLSARVLWQDTEGLISGVSLSEGIVRFSASSLKGNAIIAVYDNANPDATGSNILWSWHIWCTDSPSSHNYINHNGSPITVLDRNLGATASDPGSYADAEVVATFGLFYQWGRKDPFTGSASSSSGVEKALYGVKNYISIEPTSELSGTIANTIKYPNICYYSNGDWLYSERNDYLWGNPYGYNFNATVPYSSDGISADKVILPKKSIYDPCPEGYMVAPVDTWTRFTSTGINSTVSSELNVDGSFNKGWRFYYSADKSGNTAWYPASGRRAFNSGALELISSYGFLWSSSPLSLASDKGYILDYQNVAVTPLSTPHQRSYSFTVRCVAELYKAVNPERKALVAFYNATGGDKWKNNTNWCSDKDISEWYGVKVNGEGKVVEINLKDNKLSGSIQSTISLEYLSRLYVGSTFYPADTINYNNLTSVDASGFPNLVELDCEFNELTSVNVGSNPELYFLACGGNYLTGVDVSKNTKLTLFYCQANKITSIDVSNNPDLYEFACHVNHLSSLNVSNNTALIWLTFGNNSISNIDLSNNPHIKTLVLNNNNFTNLDITNLTELVYLSLESNSITNLNFKNNPKIEYCDCSMNNISSLDLSNNSGITTLKCYSNRLTSLSTLSILNLSELICGSQQNGANISVVFTSFQKSLWDNEWKSLDNNTNVTVSTGRADLSSSVTANCYIVPSSGDYSFNATVIGNGSKGLLPDIAQSDKLFHTETVSISPLSVKILWQDVDGLISNLSLSSGKINFTASSSEGNAVIAVYDKADPAAEGAKILWSWHIWCTDYPSSIYYYNRSCEQIRVMDRNLGATASPSNMGFPEDYVATYGLFYEWGRKDPFSRNSSLYSIEANSAQNGTIESTIAHPSTYYYNSTSPYDWKNAPGNDYLWGNPFGYNYNATVPYSSDGTASGTVIIPEKSIYDPCPVGYMVTSMNAWTRFTTTGDNSSVSSEFNVNGSFKKGWSFYCYGDKTGNTTWYPAAGSIGCTSGTQSNADSNGYYWSSSPVQSAILNSAAMFLSESYIDPLYNGGGHSNGFSVRCVKE